MKSLYVIVFLFTIIFFNKSYAAAGDNVTTASKVIANVRIEDAGTNANYYFVSKTGSWDVAGCPGVIYAYLEQSSKISAATLSAALTSKTANLPISFHGVCGSGSGNMAYMQIKYVIF